MTARFNKTKKVTVLGYGSQGRAVALNLRDSGFDVTVGLPSKSNSRKKAKQDGIQSVTTTRRAVKDADIVCMALPDHRQKDVYNFEIKDFLKAKACLWFLHGLSIHFGLVQPAMNCDIVLLAPHAPGIALREQYQGDKSLSAFYAVHQNCTGTARKTIYKLSAGLGFQRNRLVETTFEQEAVGDLFGEQVVLCGGLASLIKNGFETLVDNGLPADHAYLEVAYQLDLIISLIKQYGIEGMLDRISVAARFGAIKNGPKIVNQSTRRSMQKIYNEIKSGKFVKELDNLKDSEIRDLKRAGKNLSHDSLEKAARKYRK